MKYNPEKIPENLHFLIPMVEKWMAVLNPNHILVYIYDLSDEDLLELATAIDVETEDMLNEWLGKGNEIPMPIEVADFTDFRMNSYEAESILKNRGVLWP